MNEHYYTENPLSEERIKYIRLNILGNDLRLKTVSGVFSFGRLDKGTETLLKYCKVEEGDKLLDLGTGYGVVGISLAKAYPKNEVWMSDINKRAIKFARENIKLNGVTNTRVKSGNMFEKLPGDFDKILINPPLVAGKKVCEAMIEGSYEKLKKGGLLQVVARKNKGGFYLSKKMEETFGNISVFGRKGGFWVYGSEK